MKYFFLSAFVYFRQHALVIIFGIALFIIPFFWYAPGEIDVGGDSSRLYLYDPVSYLRSTALFSVDPEGTANIRPNQFLLPHLVFLISLKRVLLSSHIYVTLEKSIKLSLAFLFMYLVIKAMLETTQATKNQSIHIASLLASTWYALSPSLTGNMGFSLNTHNQVFLNPMVLYFLYRYTMTHTFFYIIALLITTLIFSPNFSLTAPPPLFAFYPIALIFLFIFSASIARRSIPWKGLIVASFLFFLLHAFHIVPETYFVLHPGSDYFRRTFGEQSNAVSYFNAILGLGKVSTNIIQPPFSPKLTLLGFVPFLFILSGFTVRRPHRRVLLTGIFFFITLFLVSANITTFGPKIYRALFLIPGFGMFRNFIGQWQFVFTFFYALLLAFSYYEVASRIKRIYRNLIVGAFLIFVVWASWPFITGKTVDIRHAGTNIRAAMVFDPRYESFLSFIRSLPQDGKILTLPFTDFFHQVVAGLNDGAYVGPSSVAYLTGRNDFAGYQIMYPFPETFMKFVKEGNDDGLIQLFSLLNIRYIFHNTDPRIYDTSFSTFPYAYMKTALPQTQNAYVAFIQRLPVKTIYEKSPYVMYEIDPERATPLFFVSRLASVYAAPKGDWYGLDPSVFPNNLIKDSRIVYVESSVCQKALGKAKCTQLSVADSVKPTVKYTKVNPIKYRVSISGMKGSTILVFSNQFDTTWKAYRADKMRTSTLETRILDQIGSKLGVLFSDTHPFETIRLKALSDRFHLPVNGYANAWYIEPDAHESESVYELIIESWAQQVFYRSLLISVISFTLFTLWTVLLWIKSKGVI